MVEPKGEARSDKVSIVPLTGGFGNQLFQFAFGMHLANLGHDVKFESKMGNPRTSEGNVSILNVKCSQPVNVLDGSFHYFDTVFSKAFGWNLSNGLKPERNMEFKSRFLKLVSIVLFSLKFRNRIRIEVNKDLGLDQSINLSEPSIFLGYFQTHFYASTPKVFEALSEIQPKQESAKYLELKDEIVQSKPLLVHVRLTDYLRESSFGIPSRNYYRNAINQIKEKRKYRDVWLVSDDVETAAKYLDGVYGNLQLTLFNQTDFCDTELWSLMRYFSGYVISNSTFAWWAAFLRHNQEVPVYAPDPWFKMINDPKMLIPENWNKVSSL